jgi:uncharacterized protein YbjT (DUF2867 family)
VSVLLVAPAGETGDAVVSRLLEAGDEVRVVSPPSDEAERWRARGAHIARGDPRDPDLIERAAQTARSIVTFDDGYGGPEILEAALEAAVGAGVERIIVCSSGSETYARNRLAGSSLEHLVLLTGAARRRRFPLRARPVTPGDVAAAVDAADDLAGHPRLVLDLRQRDAWGALNLEPPGR